MLLFANQSILPRRHFEYKYIDASFLRQKLVHNLNNYLLKFSEFDFSCTKYIYHPEK